MLTYILFFFVGLVILAVGAELLIRGAVQIARRFGISPFVIGVTIVGFGTSAPELVVTLSAVMNDQPDLAVGNVVGSNIANVGLILGIAVLIRPMTANMRLLKSELPIMLAITLLFWFLVRDNLLSRYDAGILCALLVVFSVYVYRTSRKEPREVQAEIGEIAAVKGSTRRGALFVILGLAGLVGGAEIMVKSAVEIARTLGVSELMIGLTVVAVGTSLPELASTIAAALRSQADIAIGNIVGSNIFNLLMVLGITGLVLPLGVSNKVLYQEIPVMVCFSFLMLPVLINGLRLERWEGMVFLTAYAGFIGWQVVSALGW